jgi:hypothetical protein
MFHTGDAGNAGGSEILNKYCGGNIPLTILADFVCAGIPICILLRSKVIGDNITRGGKVEQHHFKSWSFKDDKGVEACQADCKSGE